MDLRKIKAHSKLCQQFAQTPGNNTIAFTDDNCTDLIPPSVQLVSYIITHILN